MFPVARGFLILTLLRYTIWVFLYLVVTFSENSFPCEIVTMSLRVAWRLISRALSG